MAISGVLQCILSNHPRCCATNSHLGSQESTQLHFFLHITSPLQLSFPGTFVDIAVGVTTNPVFQDPNYFVAPISVELDAACTGRLAFADGSMALTFLANAALSRQLDPNKVRLIAIDDEFQNGDTFCKMTISNVVTPAPYNVRAARSTFVVHRSACQTTVFNPRIQRAHLLPLIHVIGNHCMLFSTSCLPFQPQLAPEYDYTSALFEIFLFIVVNDNDALTAVVDQGITDIVLGEGSSCMLPVQLQSKPLDHLTVGVSFANLLYLGASPSDLVAETNLFFGTSSWFEAQTVELVASEDNYDGKSSRAHRRRCTLRFGNQEHPCFRLALVCFSCRSSPVLCNHSNVTHRDLASFLDALHSLSISVPDLVVRLPAPFQHGPRRVCRNQHHHGLQQRRTSSRIYLLFSRFHAYACTLSPNSPVPRSRSVALIMLTPIRPLILHPAWNVRTGLGHHDFVRPVRRLRRHVFGRCDPHGRRDRHCQRRVRRNHHGRPHRPSPIDPRPLRDHGR